jgi:hypothetical protein
MENAIADKDKRVGADEIDFNQFSAFTSPVILYPQMR